MRPAPPNDDLSAWLDGELTEDRAAELEAELQRDPALRAELEELEAVVRDAGPRQAPNGFAHWVMARVDQEEAKSARSAWAWLRRPWGIPLEGWALGLPAAAAILLLLPIGKGPGEPAPEEAPREVSPAALDTRPAPTVDPVDGVAPPAPVTGKDEPAVEKGLERGDAEPVARKTPSSEKGTGTADPGLGTDLGTRLGTGVGTGTSVEPAPAPAPGLKETPVPTGTGTYAVDLPQSPVRVVLQGDDPKMKRQILSLAARYGGAQQDGRPVTSAKMAAERESVVVWLPQSDLSGFTKQIEALGYPMTVENTGELVAGQSVPLRIDLEPLPDARAIQAAPPAVDAPNAAEQTAE